MEYGFFNSLNGDRKYNARDISRYFEHIMSSGLYRSVAGNMKVSAAGGMALLVAPGAGLIDCQWFRDENNATVTIGTASPVMPRIDSVVIRLDLNEVARSIVLDVVEGTPAETPEAPAPVRTDKIKELVIAHVYVGALATEITDANITDTRADEKICGWVQSLIDAPLLTQITTVYTTTAGSTSVIPIDVSAYNATTDILNIYIGGLRLTPGVDYTINRDTLTITLAKAVSSGTKINIEALKPVIPDDLPESAEVFESVLNEVSAYNTRISALEEALEGGTGGDGVQIVAATSADGAAYTAAVDGVGELHSGLLLTIIPDMTSTTTAITLDVNGIGAKPVLVPLSNDTAIMTQPRTESYFVNNRPVLLQFDAAYLSTGVWKTVEKQRTDAADLYGTVPVAGGGTGADNVADARENLGVYSKTETDAAIGNAINAITDYEGVTF